jgi:hypothetical protein
LQPIQTLQAEVENNIPDAIFIDHNDPGSVPNIDAPRGKKKERYRFHIAYIVLMGLNNVQAQNEFLKDWLLLMECDRREDSDKGMDI